MIKEKVISLGGDLVIVCNSFTHTIKNDKDQIILETSCTCAKKEMKEDEPKTTK